MKPLTQIRKIWLCDDDEDDHFVFAEALRQALPHAQLTSFRNGSEMLSQLDQSQPDIVFLDINMPIINGIETLKAIKQRPEYSELPVIIYSVSIQPTDIDNTFNFGAVLYLVKPQLFQELVQLLKKIFALDWNDRESISSLKYEEGKLKPFNPVN